MSTDSPERLSPSPISEDGLAEHGGVVLEEECTRHGVDPNDLLSKLSTIVSIARKNTSESLGEAQPAKRDIYDDNDQAEFKSKQHTLGSAFNSSWIQFSMSLASLADDLSDVKGISEELSDHNGVHAKLRNIQRDYSSWNDEIAKFGDRKLYSVDPTTVKKATEEFDSLVQQLSAASETLRSSEAYKDDADKKLLRSLDGTIKASEYVKSNYAKYNSLLEDYEAYSESAPVLIALVTPRVSEAVSTVPSGVLSAEVPIGASA